MSAAPTPGSGRAALLGSPSRVARLVNAAGSATVRLFDGSSAGGSMRRARSRVSFDELDVTGSSVDGAIARVGTAARETDALRAPLVLPPPTYASAAGDAAAFERAPSTSAAPAPLTPIGSHSGGAEEGADWSGGGASFRGAASPSPARAVTGSGLTALATAGDFVPVAPQRGHVFLLKVSLGVVYALIAAFAAIALYLLIDRGSERHTLSFAVAAIFVSLAVPLSLHGILMHLFH
jgi:hypothetical protein